MDSLLLEVVQSVDDFDLRPTQSVQLGDTEEVSFTEHRETGTELVSLVQVRGAADLLKEDLFASICFEVFHLRIGGLMGGGAPCVSDFPSHRSERVCVSERIAEKQPNALSERILGLFSWSELLFAPVGATQGFPNTQIFRFRP